MLAKKYLRIFSLMSDMRFELESVVVQNALKSIRKTVNVHNLLKTLKLNQIYGNFATLHIFINPVSFECIQCTFVYKISPFKKQITAELKNRIHVAKEYFYILLPKFVCGHRREFSKAYSK